MRTYGRVKGLLSKESPTSAPSHLIWLVLVCIYVANIITCHSEQQNNLYLFTKTERLALSLLQGMELAEEVDPCPP